MEILREVLLLEENESPKIALFKGIAAVVVVYAFAWMLLLFAVGFGIC